MNGRKYSRKPYRKPVRKSAPKRNYRRKSTFVKKVQRVITKMAEKKQTTTTQINVGLTTGDNSVLVPYIALAPILSQGSAENGRIGNSVMVKYARIAGYVNMLPYNSITNTFPCIKLKMWLVSYKNRNASATNDQTLVIGDMATFFENGASGVPFQGTMYDAICPCNSSRWTVHSTRTFDLTLGGASTAYPNTTAPVVGNGSFQKYFSFDFAKHLGKLMYDDTSGSNYPTNKNCFLIMQPITADGSSRQAGPVAEIHYRYDVQYTDL